MTHNDDYLTRQEAAVYAGVSLPTIDRRLRDGKLEKVSSDLLPGRVLIPRMALDVLLRRRIKGRTHASTTER